MEKMDIVLEDIVIALEESGYSPCDQLYAYLITQNESYITRKRNAREKIKKLAPEVIKTYLKNCNLQMDI